jgi:hypothetical protein
MGYFTIKKIMGSKVVSTKLTEEEYGKLVGLCSASGYTVSKLLKRAILERMNEETSREYIHVSKPEIKREEQIIQKPLVKKSTGLEERFLYY